jgi:cation diffusion facilitator CzcD-associated flavoprotein CzcO
VARHFNIDELIRFDTRVVNAQWSEATSTWTLYADDGSRFESEVFINAGGILNNPQMPDIEGLDSFAGQTLHTAAWDASVDLRGKTIGVIGAGASAVQLLPQIQPLASKVNMFIRTPSWISPPIALADADVPNPEYVEQEKSAFREDDMGYLESRKHLETQFNNMFDAFFKASPQQKDMRQRFEARMRSLIHDEELQRRLIPSFEAGCRRINPGEQYLIALQELNVQPVFDGIERVTSRGVVAGGVEYPCDVLVTATGFNTTFRPRFPIVGRNGANLQELWSKSPESYLGTGVSGFPNYMIFLGPNTPISNGSLMGTLSPMYTTQDPFETDAPDRADRGDWRLLHSDTLQDDQTARAVIQCEARCTRRLQHTHPGIHGPNGLDRHLPQLV